MFNHPKRTANTILQILAHGKVNGSMRNRLEGILDKIHRGGFPSMRESETVERMFKDLN